MKKTLVALAAVAATSAAFAEVTVFGIVDQAVVRTKTGTAASVTQVGGMLTGSELGFKGSEDLGNGLKADFQIHFSPSIDGSTAATALNGTTVIGATNGPRAYQSHVGLSGGFGRVRIGQFFSPSFFNNVTYDGIGMAPVNTSVAYVNGGANLYSNAIEYTLPDIVSGLGVSYMNSQGETANNIGGMTNIRVNYAIGAFSVGYATDTTNTSTTVDTKSTSLGASYDFGLAKVSMLQADSKPTGGATTKGSAFAVSVPFGATSVTLQTSTSGSDKGNHVLVKHDLSKRTSALLHTGSKKVSSVTTTSTAFGLWHAF